jgi:S1-C subfamily serine protease
MMLQLLKAINKRETPMNTNRYARLRFSAAILALALCLTTARSAWAEQSVYQKTLQATGFVVVTKEKDQLGYGTCWIVDHDQRLAVTNIHVVEMYNKCKVAFPRFIQGQVVTSSAKYSAKDFIAGKVLARDAKRDLALIQLERLPAGTRALALAPASIAPGSKIWAVGNSGMAHKWLTEGTLWRSRKGTVKNGFFKTTRLRGTTFKLEAHMIQTDSGSKPGDSGGPVVDEQGRLVGVNSSSDEQGDYAIDVNELRVFLSRSLPGKNFPSPPSPLIGTWTVTWKYKGSERFAGLTLNADGTGLWDGTNLSRGSYSDADGKLTLDVPGSGLDGPLELTWKSNNSFRFAVRYAEGPTDFTVTRR